MDRRLSYEGDGGSGCCIEVSSYHCESPPCCRLILYPSPVEVEERKGPGSYTKFVHVMFSLKEHRNLYNSYCTIILCLRSTLKSVSPLMICLADLPHFSGPLQFLGVV